MGEKRRRVVKEYKQIWIKVVNYTRDTYENLYN